MEDVIGINSERLDSLIFDIGNERDEISNILNSIEDTQSHLTECYKCPAGVNFATKFNGVATNFPQITQNLDVYAEDLIRAKSNNARLDFKAQTVANQAIIHLEDLTNKHINTEVK